MTVYADLYRYRDLFSSLFRRDFQARYKGSAFGVLWSLAHPLVLMGVYALVFSALWQVTDIARYPLFLLAGLLVWVFFSTSIQGATRSLLDSATLIRKTRFPRQLVPLSVVATNLVGFGVMLAVLVPLDFALVPETRDTIWLAFPLAVLVVALVSGLALTVACLNVLYRDVEHLVSALMLPWFFLTPIVYTRESLPGYEGVVDALHYLNPLAPAVTALRDPLFFGRLPSAVDTLYLAAAAAAALALGAWVFSRADDRIAVEL